MTPREQINEALCSIGEMIEELETKQSQIQGRLDRLNKEASKLRAQLEQDALEREVEFFAMHPWHTKGGLA